MTTEATVTPIKQPDSPETIGSRCFAALQALEWGRDRATDGLKQATAKWSQQITEATKAYREVLRDNDSSTQKEGKRLFDEAKSGLEEHDRVLEAAKADKSERRRQIASIDEARKEVLAVRADDSQQVDLFDRGTITGLAWASQSTCSAIYECLMWMADGDQLASEEQSALLSDLSGAGIENIDLGLAPGEAIEKEVEDDDPGDYDPEATEDEDLPF